MASNRRKFGRPIHRQPLPIVLFLGRCTHVPPTVMMIDERNLTSNVLLEPLPTVLILGGCAHFPPTSSFNFPMFVLGFVLNLQTGALITLLAIIAISLALEILPHKRSTLENELNTLKKKIKRGGKKEEVIEHEPLDRLRIDVPTYTVRNTWVVDPQQMLFEII
ncbi:hypothetical protein ACMD2_08024 [Ananas comosus]|uniref:Uncharacterized protein n=1 Tax=Ananas comosus TaxID=4615 RepID=A0A199W6R7_ANACO|nr:hypothetical protein ACMD2_08024 [Ananas comosus]